MFGQIIIFVLLALSSSAKGQYKLTVNVTQKGTKEAFVTCQILANKPSSTMDVVWVQRLEGEKDVKGGGGEDKEFEIGKNDRIFDEFKAWNKYEVVKNKLARSNIQRTYKLKISDLKTTDSGQIGCRLENTHVSVFKPLVVIAKPGGIVLKSSNMERSEASIYQHNEKVSFNEGSRRHFSCVVTKTHPIPQVSIMLGEKDISDKFEKSIKLTRKISPNHQQSKSFVSELFYDVSLSAASLEISHEFYKKELTCLVKYAEDDKGDSGSYEERTSIRINLNGFKPKFICDGGEIEENDGGKVQYYQAKLHHVLFPIKCSVLGLPRVKKVKVQWKKPGGRQVVIRDGQKLGNYLISVEDDEEDKNAKVLTFKISRLSLQHFRTYTLVASNELGETHYHINLAQFEPRTEALTSSAEVISSMATAITTLLSSMMASLWFY